MFKHMKQHQLELRLHSMKPRVMLNLLFQITELLFTLDMSKDGNWIVNEHYDEVVFEAMPPLAGV
jgi:hypothetical protein